MKLGYHVNDLTGPAVSAIDRFLPDWLLFLDLPSFSQLRQWLQRNPNLTVVIRHYEPPPDTLDNFGDRVDRLLRWTAPLYGVAKNIVLEMPMNEAFQTGDGLKKYCDAQWSYVKRLSSEGYISALLNLSVGWPKLPEFDGDQGSKDMDVIAELIRDCSSAGFKHYLSLHEYGLPNNQFDMALCGRHRRIWNALLDRSAPAPMIITEFGWDYRLVEPGFSGWNSHGNSPESFANFVANYAMKIAASPYLHGVMTYCLDARDSAWHSYAIANYDSILKAHVQKYGDQALWFPGFTVPGYEQTGSQPHPEVNPVVKYQDVVRSAPVGPGFKKVYDLWGDLGTVEYHTGSPGHDRAFVSNDKCTANWVQETNETVAYKVEDGSIWRDGGNKPLDPSGKLVPVA